MDFHDAANIFPLDDDSIPALADDIRQNKQQIAIELMDGKVLDGRRRWLACIQAGVKPLTREVNVADPIAYVLSLNLHRRHLTPTQLSMVGGRATELRDRLAADADARKKSGKKDHKENLPSGQTRDQIGKAVGVSGKSIDHASKVLRDGTPKLIAAVEGDKIAVSTAAKVALMPAQQQDEFVERAKGKPTTRKAVVKAEDKPEGEVRGVGVTRANEAINCLIRIPKNDALRKRGFQIVTDWIKANK
jgi:ParB-like chromosome segregation protein Spo0J